MRLTQSLLLPSLMLLGACGQEAAPEQDGRSASGEVLEGTISDAMLPLASVRSQPPLLDPEAAEQVRSRTVPAAGSSAAPAEEAAEGESGPDDAADEDRPEPPAPAQAAVEAPATEE